MQVWAVSFTNLLWALFPQQVKKVSAIPLLINIMASAMFLVLWNFSFFTCTTRSTSCSHMALHTGQGCSWLPVCREGTPCSWCLCRGHNSVPTPGGYDQHLPFHPTPILYTHGSTKRKSSLLSGSFPRTPQPVC